jgi:ABC-type dipeptide/oligopeptide/nickel transport system permease component
MNVLSYVAQRVVTLIPTLIGLIILTFFLSRVVPADPAALIAGEGASRQQIEALRQRYGFDQPLLNQLGLYLGQLATGNLGTSIYTGRSVLADLQERFPATLELTLVSMVLATVLGIPLGVWSALKHNSWLDHMLRACTTAGLAITGFWLAIMLQLFFSMELDLFPLGGRIEVPEPQSLTGFFLLDALLTLNGTAFLSALKHITLPALTLAYPAFATIARFTRSGVLDVMQRDFMLYEKAMGLPRLLITFKYLLRNALTSTVAQIGLLFGSLLAGAVVTEQVFDWPGLGLYAVESIMKFDYQATLGITLWAGVAYSGVNLMVELAQAIIDPRVVRR